MTSSRWWRSIYPADVWISHWCVWREKLVSSMVSVPPNSLFLSTTNSVAPPTQWLRPPIQWLRSPTQWLRPPTQGLRPPTDWPRPPTNWPRPPTQWPRPPTQWPCLPNSFSSLTRCKTVSHIQWHECHFVIATVGAVSCQGARRLWVVQYNADESTYFTLSALWPQ